MCLDEIEDFLIEDFFGQAASSCCGCFVVLMAFVPASGCGNALLA
jgi:hypothetical protein